MFVNRDGIPTNFHVLPHMPHPPMVETLKWQTKTFIAADLSEFREPWIDVPAVTIQYNYTLNRNLRSELQEMLDNDLIWVIPYLPHMTRAGYSFFGYAPNLNYPYKYGQYVAYISRRHLFYRRVDDNLIPQDHLPPRWEELATETVWMCPCWTAYVDRKINYTYAGRCLDGDRIKLTFRLTADAEHQQYYEVQPPYEFPNFLTVPHTITDARNQTMLDPKMTVPHSYQPTARMPDETQQLAAKYFLRYDDQYRDDYQFRGAFNWAKGSLISQDWVGDQSFWRLADDKINITYNQGYADANLNLRKAI